MKKTNKEKIVVLVIIIFSILIICTACNNNTNKTIINNTLEENNTNYTVKIVEDNISVLHMNYECVEYNATYKPLLVEKRVHCTKFDNNSKVTRVIEDCWKFINETKGMIVNNTKCIKYRVIVK